MADLQSSSHPAPPPCNLADSLQRLDSMLARLGKDGGTAPARLRPNHACELLRQRLAVRGWAAPLELLQDVALAERDAALRTVGAEVELSERARPGQWFMGLAARKRFFAAADCGQLRKAAARLTAADDADPTRLALLVALDFRREQLASGPADIPQALARLAPDVLRELERTLAWAGSLRALEALAASAGAEFRRRVRDRQLDSVAGVVFGREREQAAISSFLQADGPEGPTRTLYVSGIGGSGKSTLLLVAEREARATGRHVVIRLDFDSPSLNPRNPEQMDIQLLDALSVELPGDAQELQRMSRHLRTLMDHRARAQLQAEGATQSFSASSASRRGAKDVRRAKYAAGSGSAAEDAANSKSYGRYSALSALRGIEALHTHTAVLFLDTLENVTKLGADAIDTLLDWLTSVVRLLARPQGGQPCVVIAGRDRLGSADMGGMMRHARAHDIGLQPEDEVVLSDLDIDAAGALLNHFGMRPDAAARAAATLPRNPLVLRLAARAYQSGPQQARDIEQAHLAGRIDRHTAAGYLAQRVIQHVPSHPARRYVLAAMALPEITERLLRDLVIPAVDGPGGGNRRELASAIYQGLQQTSWLTIEHVPGAFHWHAELHALALPMIQADPVHAPVAARVLDAARGWYAGKRSPAERGLAQMYRDGGRDKSLGGGIVKRFNKMLGWAIETSGMAGDRPEDDSSAEEAQWHRIRVEGINGEAGEGDRLVGQGHVERALQVYRERPTRDAGVPPTFVLRALALSGEPYAGDVDPDRVLAELRAHLDRHGERLQRREVEHLYWLTRLLMLDRGQLEATHVELLRDVCHALKFRQEYGPLFGLVATVEALQLADEARPIAPSAWPPAQANVGPELRFTLVRASHGHLEADVRGHRWIATRLSAMLCLDEGWLKLFLYHVKRGTLAVDGGLSRAAALRDDIRSLRSAPLVEVEQMLASCRDLRVGVDLARLAPQDAPSLLRGGTVEFQMPLATRLSTPALWGAEFSAGKALDKLLDFIHDLHLPARKILPLHNFSGREQPYRHAQDLKAAVTALVVALDRADALGRFCTVLSHRPEMLFGQPDRPEATRLRVLCARMGAWDSALSQRGSLP